MLAVPFPGLTKTFSRWITVPREAKPEEECARFRINFLCRFKELARVKDFKVIFRFLLYYCYETNLIQKM